MTEHSCELTIKESKPLDSNELMILALIFIIEKTIVLAVTVPYLGNALE